MMLSFLIYSFEGKHKATVLVCLAWCVCNCALSALWRLSQYAKADLVFIVWVLAHHKCCKSTAFKWIFVVMTTQLSAWANSIWSWFCVNKFSRDRCDTLKVWFRNHLKKKWWDYMQVIYVTTLSLLKWHPQLIVAVSVEKPKDVVSTYLPSCIENCCSALQANIIFDVKHATPWPCISPFFYFGTYVVVSCFAAANSGTCVPIGNVIIKPYGEILTLHLVGSDI